MTTSSAAPHSIAPNMSSYKGRPKSHALKILFQFLFDLKRPQLDAVGRRGHWKQCWSRTNIWLTIRALWLQLTSFHRFQVT